MSEDWEARLDELLGIDSRQRHETEAFKEADAIANEALYAGGPSWSEENPGPNGETFSLATRRVSPSGYPAILGKVHVLGGRPLNGFTEFDAAKRRAYGLRSFETLQTALYHNLGALPPPQPPTDFAEDAEKYSA